MTQATRVYKVSKPQLDELEARLREQLPPDAEWRRVPHARCSVKTLGVVLTCYESGKVVLQGREAATFEARFLSSFDVAKSKAASSNADADIPFDRPTIGSDETGKGDYFGPLVVAACHADPGQAELLAELGVTDSKALTDKRAVELAGAIESELDHEVVVLNPVDYNARFEATGNSNVFLAEMHAEALHAVAERNPETSMFVVDRFGNEKLVADALRKLGTEPETLVQVPRAERHAAVAAASIVARAHFLEGMKACEDSCGTDLHKGAGAPVDVAAKRVVAIGGIELLGTVAKMHFKNTQKLGD